MYEMSAGGAGNRRLRRLMPWLVALIWLSAAPASWADIEARELSTEGATVQHFFSGCPRKLPRKIHNAYSARDPHAIAYAVGNVMELEVIRLADWLIDLPWPGPELRPLERGADTMRAWYAHLGRSRPVERFGELVDALQIRQLSLGDYTAVAGGNVSSGSGMVVRINKLIDWTQHLVGDMNRLIGWPVRRPDGLVTWAAPGRLVDHGQRIMVKLFHGLTVLIVQGIDGGIAGSEYGVERLVNAPRPAPHHLETVFLRLSPNVYRVHELWILAHRRSIYVGTTEELAGLTHAEIFHPRRAQRHGDTEWWNLERLTPEPPSLVLVTDRRTFATAPPSMAAYVVPAAWVLTPSEGSPLGSEAAR